MVKVMKMFTWSRSEGLPVIVSKSPIVSARNTQSAHSIFFLCRS